VLLGTIGATSLEARRPTANQEYASLLSPLVSPIPPGLKHDWQISLNRKAVEAFEVTALASGEREGAV
jgi:hypothetical protein